jgi:hypothetical protein
MTEQLPRFHCIAETKAQTSFLICLLFLTTPGPFQRKVKA